MKNYSSRTELHSDINFLRSIIDDQEYLNYLIIQLVDCWKDTSPDSPWFTENKNENDFEAATTLVKISRDTGKSNQWKGEHTVFNQVNTHSYNLRSKR
tara:strand:+ start:149 stop:442 length:294 start_codon:yes stop_codon:yes gene_type:complete